jgi:phosphohistidine phosphatase
MDLLVVRHAVAEDRETFAATGKSDTERPLTAAGRRKFKRAARGLHQLVEAIDLLATSSLVRAVQTGDILQKIYGIDGVVRLRELSPEAEPASLVRWLVRQRTRGLVAVVGHEPHLSTLAEHLLTGRRGEFLDLKKGGACLLALGGAPAAGRAELRWLLTAAQLGALAR